MASLKGTRTEQNLLKAFAGESQARNRYDFAAKQAVKDGFLQIAEIFNLTAENEREHAKNFFNFLEGGPLEIMAAYPAGLTADTASNLRAAAAGEREEWTILYPEFAKIAREEGFEDVARKFDLVAKVEKEHETRYATLLQNVEMGKVFKKDQPVRWICRKCGFTHEGTTALATCPLCKHPQSHMEIYMANY
jgi:rubrerythrin